jgi:predicted PurR-regulated permease PerM
MKDIITLPFYSKLAYTLISLIAITVILYLGQEIIIPILLALLFAILLSPVVCFLDVKLHLPNIISVILTITFTIVLILALLTFISWEISDITNDWDRIHSNLLIHLHNFQEVLTDHFKLNETDQQKIFDNASKNALETGKNLVSSTLVSFSDMLMNLTLIPIYTFLFLLYKNHFIVFLTKLINVEYHVNLRDILTQIKVSVQSYIVGLLIEMLIVAILTTVGFMIIGVQYAIVLGIIAAILNLIPYVGILIAAAISILATLTGTPDLTIIFGVIIVVIIVQVIDNNILVPLIISSKVEINAFVSIVGIIIGGTLFGFSGMFLAIPMIAILKVIFDRIESLSPWGYIMGDDIPKNFTWHPIAVEDNSEITTAIATENEGNSKNIE